jgi:hypothetical protein
MQKEEEAQGVQMLAASKKIWDYTVRRENPNRNVS